MSSTANWWPAEIDWATPSGRLLQRLQASLPADRAFHLTVYGSAPLQLTLDRELLSGHVDLFSDDDEDLSGLIAAAGLDKSHGGLHLEFGFELSFRTSPRWRQRAKIVTLANVTFAFPHPIDILIGKLDRLEPKGAGNGPRCSARTIMASDGPATSRRLSGRIPRNAEARDCRG